jgi:ubiquitin-conjugating enzyme E2 M
MIHSKPNKKNEMQEILGQNEANKKTLNFAEIRIRNEFVEIEELLQKSVPQAKLIKNKDKDDVMNFQVEITPDEKSFWYGGVYLFNFSFNNNFPYSPPKIHCLTKIYHPNIDFDGNVCLNILKQDWNPTFCVLSCIVGVYFLFVEPNPNDPLNQEAAQEMKNNINTFKLIIKHTLKGGMYFQHRFPSFK